ncbi:MULTISPECIES: DUF3592 domain-containing protein [unclassified Streptomyces]|uniref:DUF3592 domain-containing protein n=1 Tax=unclassified Streptomyces TaxID=2593676 RepID=UPI002E816E87|nr:DUF3592 domain-containing protein [Streptomyces sp. NBC_00589]WTI37572.1 hypothetical protein OIC96_22440 [Streptomyces sp. NBC_00775]WUB28750.1 hypothetical protein OHA51_27295 [Streptomyces sp. NBC_00589]
MESRPVESVLSRLSRWWPTAAAVTVALFGVLILTIQIRQLHGSYQELANLREHGRHTTAHATVSTTCSSGVRDTTCDTSSVWLDFNDTSGDPVDEPEETIDGSLYVPDGHRDAEGRVATTVVYDPAHPDLAQAEGALDQGVLDLATHHWIALTIGLVALGAGISGGVAAWPPRRAGR